MDCTLERLDIDKYNQLITDKKDAELARIDKAVDRAWEEGN